MSVLRFWGGREQAKARLETAMPHLRAASIVILRLSRLILGAIWIVLWRLASAAWVWLITESPLSEPRRNAHRPLIVLLVWVVVAIGWVTILSLIHI